MDRFSDWGDGGSAIGYDTWRRRRRWSLSSRNGLQGYAAYLMGVEGGESAGNELASIIGAEAAAYEGSSLSSDTSRVIFVGVATGVLTFLLNRWLGKVLK